MAQRQCKQITFLSECICIIIYIHFIIPFGKFGPPHRAALSSPTSACWVFRVSEIHRTLTGTTGSLSCVCDHSYACAYTRGLCTPTTSQHIFDSEKLTDFSCAPGGLRTSSPMLYQLSHPSPPMHGKFGMLYPGKTSSHSAALPISFFSCVQCFRISILPTTTTTRNLFQKTHVGT